MMAGSSASAGPRTGAQDRRALLARLRAEITGFADEVDTVRRSEGFSRFLEAMALFWHYSPFNSWLIRGQQPGATRVAGAQTWAKLGRTVKKDAEPIVIWAPTKRGYPFILVSVFDVSDTEGRPLPTLDTSLRGSTRKTGTLETAAERLGIKIAALEGHANLVGVSVGGEIRIRAGIPSQERAATLAHELAHEILHQQASTKKRLRLSHAEQETEAEATAHLVLRVLGLPTKSPAYVAWQGGDGKMVLSALGRVQRAARRILEAAGIGCVAGPAS
jgi:hypothetical protein